ncbi:serine/threonine-protein phosphatase 4 regulatory subunit 4-like [Liolophura sinensis]|uniref:serine/threonine-protein phosphatase 4 regulatory subunit 4-like n=1 Tax=Liolophura sinensis TaxID=3198878 RepID=UPI0031581C2B
MEEPSAADMHELKQSCDGQTQVDRPAVEGGEVTAHTPDTSMTNGDDPIEPETEGNESCNNCYLEPDLLRHQPDVILDHECDVKDLPQGSDHRDSTSLRSLHLCDSSVEAGADPAGQVEVTDVDSKLSRYSDFSDKANTGTDVVWNGLSPDVCSNTLPVLPVHSQDSVGDGNTCSSASSHSSTGIHDKDCDAHFVPGAESDHVTCSSPLSPIKECDSSICEVSRLSHDDVVTASHCESDDQLFSVKNMGMKTYLEENLVMFDCPDEVSTDSSCVKNTSEADHDSSALYEGREDKELVCEGGRDRVGSPGKDSPIPDSWLEEMTHYDSPIPRVHIQHSDPNPDLDDDFVDNRSIFYPGSSGRCYSPVDVQVRNGVSSYLEDEPMFFGGPDDSGQEVQRISVINNLPDLLRDNHAECMRRVVPKVREVLHVAQAEMQLAASSAFLQILQKELVPIQNYTQTFLQTILISVDSKDPDVANAWLETLLDVIDLLPKDVIKKDILSIAVAKGQLSQSVQARLACSRILGKISTKFEPFVIKKEILPVVQSMCQDIDYEVRGCMCRQLDPVARGLGLEATKSAILPELVELTNDEESHVRIAGLETVVNILSLLDDETCKNTIVPLVCKFCQQSVLSQDSTLPVVAKQFGKLCHGLSINLMDDQKLWFMDYYRQLCRVGLSDKAKSKEAEPSSPSIKVNLMGMDMFDEEDKTTECRRHAAFNFPALVMFAGAKSFKSELYLTFSQLCTDPNLSVRKTVASGLHEVAGILGVNVSVLQPDLMRLLKDESAEVLKGVVAHLPQTLELLARAGGPTITESKMNHLADIIPALLAAEKVIFSSNNWRLQEELMTNLSCLPKCFTSDAIFSRIIPMVYKNVQKARALPVRRAAGRTLLILSRNIKRLEQREECYTNIIEDFCHSSSCYQRGLFIDLCKVVIEIYSKQFFKEHFYEAVLELSVDPVPNIRLKLCSILPQLKKVVKVPSDRALLQQLETCVRKLLINEKDKDVNACVKQAVEELDRIHVQMETIKKRMFFEEDIADERKEEEEKRLIEQEERERKDEEAKPKSDKKKDASKKDNCSSKIPSPRRVSTGGKATGSSSREKIGSAGRDLKKTPSTTSTVTGTTSSTRNKLKHRSLSGPISPVTGNPLSRGARSNSSTTLHTSHIPRRATVASQNGSTSTAKVNRINATSPVPFLHDPDEPWLPMLMSVPQADSKIPVPYSLSSPYTGISKSPMQSLQVVLMLLSALHPLPISK